MILRQKHMINPMGLMKKANLELFAWIIALIVLAFLNPDTVQVSLCPLKYFGFHYCPGCGLGRSIALLFRGRFVEAYNMHPLGFFAVAIFGYRIVELGRAAMQSEEEKERRVHDI
jgi:hypothetical protein